MRRLCRLPGRSASLASCPFPGGVANGVAGRALSLDDCRLDADYRHGTHFTALPTAWVSGFDKFPVNTDFNTKGLKGEWEKQVAGQAAGITDCRRELQGSRAG